ncbi:IS66 family insertion sequence element accessory protein TnpA, partial [Vibrio alginolyticus]|nr:IS66 family insertion sequence element accessory protein TnpB [Vibrio alginolyticus]
MSIIRPDEEWMAIFQEQQQSGLSVARFCKQNQL